MAGTVTFTHSNEGRVRSITATCTGDAADGTFPATALPAFEGFLKTVTTNPGPAATTITLATSAASDDIIDTAAPHGYVAGTPVRFKTLTGGTGLTATTTYYVSATSLAAQTFRVSAALSPDTPLGFSTDITAGTVTSNMFDAPTDDYDITLVDADGLDRLQGVGVNRDVTNSEAGVIVYTSTSQHPVADVNETLTLTIANNSVKLAVVVVKLTYVPA
jgi:hypothetical protein